MLMMLSMGERRKMLEISKTLAVLWWMRCMIERIVMRARNVIVRMVLVVEGDIGW